MVAQIRLISADIPLGVPTSPGFVGTTKGASAFASNTCRIPVSLPL